MMMALPLDSQSESLGGDSGDERDQLDDALDQPDDVREQLDKALEQLDDLRDQLDLAIKRITRLFNTKRQWKKQYYVMKQYANDMKKYVCEKNHRDLERWKQRLLATMLTETEWNQRELDNIDRAVSGVGA